MFIKDEISKRINDFILICKKHNVDKLYAFGSSTNDQFNPSTSDIDLIVEINEQNPIKKGEKLMSLWDVLESFFVKKVDLISERSIQNPYFKENIDKSKILIYDGASKKVLI
ncbi:MAG: nucleotidyltransferase domain-containing protein [Flavobacteriia bacterium]|nr:nucleotidyltransferase domain-containing protein [Flavobacteriia bacterium]